MSASQRPASNVSPSDRRDAGSRVSRCRLFSSLPVCSPCVSQVRCCDASSGVVFPACLPDARCCEEALGWCLCLPPCVSQSHFPILRTPSCLEPRIRKNRTPQEPSGAWAPIDVANHRDGQQLLRAARIPRMACTAVWQENQKETHPLFYLVICLVTCQTANFFRQVASLF